MGDRKNISIQIHGALPAPEELQRRPPGAPPFWPFEPPHLVATRPQDWAEPARSIIFGRQRARS